MMNASVSSHASASAAASADSAIAAALGEDAQQFLTFQVGESEYGVDLMDVREIKGWSETTRLPNTPDYMRGVINLRGAIIPIFDLRCRFGLGVTAAHAKNVVIILALGERNVGILVDAVSDIVAVGENDIKDAPQESDSAVDERFVRGLISHASRMIVLLSVDKLFNADQTIALPSPATAAPSSPVVSSLSPASQA